MPTESHQEWLERKIMEPDEMQPSRRPAMTPERKNMKQRIAELEADNKRLRGVVGAAKDLAEFYKNALGVGPLTKIPQREAIYWVMLNQALAALKETADE